MKKKCLSCKFFRVVDIEVGRCRVDKDSPQAEDVPIVKHDDICERWQDAGQNYFIRSGWVKSMKAKAEKKEPVEE